VKRRNIAETGVMENISVADFLRDLMKFDNETGRWDVSELVSKMAGNFHQAPRMIANALAVVILASNSGSMLAIAWRDRRTRFTANLRQLYASAAHPVARGRIMFATFSTVDAFVRLCMRPCGRKHFRPVFRRPLVSFSIWRPSAILDFQKVCKFNGKYGLEDQYESPCQISSKSVKPLRRYRDFSIFKDGSYPPSWIFALHGQSSHRDESESVECTDRRLRAAQQHSAGAGRRRQRRDVCLYALQEALIIVVDE